MKAEVKFDLEWSPEQIRQISTGETSLEQIDGQTLEPVRELVAGLS